MPQPLPDWREDRLAALTAEDGWLNLTDRVEIAPGVQRVGSDPSNDLILSSGPAHLGRLDAVAGVFTPAGGEARAFLKTEGFPQLRLPPFLLELHKVEEEVALRVRDLTLPRGISLRYFPDAPKWCIRAQWQALEVPVAQSVDQKGAGATTVTLTHTAQFTHEGQKITLLATHWKGGLPMFVIRDKTSGVETYAASRFLMGEEMTETEITLDFNKAFNPPCAFSDFAICPLPPRENILPFRVDAGEFEP